MTPAISGALVTVGLAAVMTTALLLSPLGAELLSLINSPVPTKHRRQPMTADEPTYIPVDVVRTKCPMCGALVFDGIVRHTIDGAVMASPEMQKEARRLIEVHERTCQGNH